MVQYAEAALAAGCPAGGRAHRRCGAAGVGRLGVWVVGLVALCGVVGRAVAAAPRAAVLVYRPGLSDSDGPGEGMSGGGRAALQDLRQALAERGIKSVADAVEQGVRARTEGPVQRMMARLGAVRELLGEGRRALSQVELERAVAVLGEAEGRVRELLSLGEAPALYAEVLRWRGVALLELNRPEAAAGCFRRAVALAPAALLTEADVRPDVVSAFARAARQAGLRVPLSIVPRVQGAALPAALLPSVVLLVDGVDMPLSRVRGQPGVELRVPPGEHIVVLRVSGYEPLVFTVPVTDEAGLDLALDVAPDPVFVELGALRRRPTLSGLGSLCGALDLDYVVVAAVPDEAGPGALGGQRFVCAARRLEAVREVRGAVPSEAERRPSLQAAAQLIDQLWQMEPAGAGDLAWLERPPYVPVVAVRAGRGARPAPVPLYRRPWLWIGVGGGAALIGGLLGGLLSPRPAPFSTLVIDPAQFAVRAR